MAHFIRNSPSNKNLFLNKKRIENNVHTLAESERFYSAFENSLAPGLRQKRLYEKKRSHLKF